jgi:hypothetical protein
MRRLDHRITCTTRLLVTSALLLVCAVPQAQGRSTGSRPGPSRPVPPVRVRPEISKAYYNGVVPGFFKTNETHLDRWRHASTVGTGGGWIGTGTDQNFHLVNLLRPRSAREPFSYVVVDTDPRVREINTVYMSLARVAARHPQPRAKFLSLISSTALPGEPLARYRAADLRQINEQLTAKPSVATLERNLRDVRDSGLCSARELRWVERFLREELAVLAPGTTPRFDKEQARFFFGPRQVTELQSRTGISRRFAELQGSFTKHLIETNSRWAGGAARKRNAFGLLYSDTNFRRVVELYEQGDLRFVTGSFTGPRTLKDIAAHFRTRHIPLRGIYVSNAEQYFEAEKGKLLENLRAFEGHEGAVMLRTGSVRLPARVGGFAKSENTVAEYAAILGTSPGSVLKLKLMDHLKATVADELRAVGRRLERRVGIPVTFTDSTAANMLELSYLRGGRARAYKALESLFTAERLARYDWALNGRSRPTELTIEAGPYDIKVFTSPRASSPLMRFKGQIGRGSRNGDYYFEPTL